MSCYTIWIIRGASKGGRSWFCFLNHFSGACCLLWGGEVYETLSYESNPAHHYAFLCKNFSSAAAVWDYLLFFAFAIIRTEVDNAHMQLISHMGDSIGDNIENMNNVMDSLLANDSVKSLAQKTRYGKTDYLKMREIQDHLNLSVTANSYMDDIILYFHQSDTVLSTQYYFSRVGGIKDRLDILAMDVDAFYQELQQENNLRFFITPVSIPKMPFVIRSNASLALDGESTVTIFIRLRRDTLNKLMREENSETFLFDKNGEYLCTSQAESIAPASEILAAAGTQKNYRGYRLLDGPSLLYMRFVRLIPQSAYSRNIFLYEAAAAFICGDLPCGRGSDGGLNGAQKLQPH